MHICAILPSISSKRIYIVIKITTTPRISISLPHTFMCIEQDVLTAATLLYIVGVQKEIQTDVRLCLSDQILLNCLHMSQSKLVQDLEKKKRTFRILPLISLKEYQITTFAWISPHNTHPSKTYLLLPTNHTLFKSGRGIQLNKKRIGLS
jgi:hypothetical protein